MPTEPLPLTCKATTAPCSNIKSCQVFIRDDYPHIYRPRTQSRSEFSQMKGRMGQGVESSQPHCTVNKTKPWAQGATSRVSCMWSGKPRPSHAVSATSPFLEGLGRGNGRVTRIPRCCKHGANRDRIGRIANRSAGKGAVGIPAVILAKRRTMAHHVAVHFSSGERPISPSHTG